MAGRRPSSSSFLVATALVVAMSACDVGDGTTLQEPVAATSTLAIDTAPLPSVPLDDPTFDGAPAIDSLPAFDEPTTSVDFPDQTVVDTGAELQFSAPWSDGAAIDIRYTCDGSDSAPSLAWTGVPAGTAELAVALVDESNLSNGRPFIHWVLAGIDPTLTLLGENDVPPGAFHGINFFGDEGYTGPCPDPGATNTYALTVFALGQQIELGPGTPGAELLDVVGTVSVATTAVRGSATR